MTGRVLFRKISNGFTDSSENVTSWLTLMVGCDPLWFFCHLFLHRELIWNQWWHLIDIQPEKTPPTELRVALDKSGNPPLHSTSCISFPEFMDCMSTRAGEDTAGRLWRNRVGKKSANGAAAPPSLAAPLQKVSLMFFFPPLILDLDNGLVYLSAYTFCKMYYCIIKVFFSAFELVTDWCTPVYVLLCVLYSTLTPVCASHASLSHLCHSFFPMFF